MKTFWAKFLERFGKIDRERMQKYLTRLSNEKGLLQSIFQNLSEAMLVIDKERKVRFINDAAKELLGISGINPINKPLIKYLADMELLKLFQSKDIDSETIINTEIEVHHPKYMLLKMNLLPYRTDTDVEGVIVVMNDITSEKKRQMENFQSEKLGALSTLAAGVAHEIGNPLNSLGIHMQLMEREIEELPRGTRKKNLTNLVNISKGEVERLDQIIRQFLGAIRPSKINYEEININQLLENLLDFMYYEISEHHIAIEKNYGSKIPPAMLDEAQIRQAFFNVIKNAIQAMPNGGVLKVTTELKNDEIYISFSDTGRGISKERINKIFDPYFTTKDRGSGLGLMIVYKIVKDHSGRIEVTSQPNKGTTITIILPVFERKIRMIPDITKREKQFGIQGSIVKE